MNYTANKWEPVDEMSLLINNAYRKWGNLIKGHILTFFEKQAVDSLKFCLVEITTLLNSNAVGEVYIFSHMPDSEASVLRERYKQVVEQIKGHKDFKNTTLSAYKAWYGKDTWIYIGNNENASHRFPSNNGMYEWNHEGEHQKEERVRTHYATVDHELDNTYIEKYLNHYIEQLKAHFDFDKYEHYAVIVKPLCLIHEKEVIPLGNMYLHFVTDKPFAIDIYMQFINEFLNVYLKSKGGRLIKEFEVALKNSTSFLPDFMPNIDRRLEQGVRADKLKNIIKTRYSDKELLLQLQAKRRDLKSELEQYLGKPRDFSKEAVDVKGTKNYPILHGLITGLKSISVGNLIRHQSKIVDDYILLRHVIMVLLCCYEVTPADVHSFLYKVGFHNYEVQTPDSYYAFYYNKLFIWVKESETKNFFSTDLVKSQELRRQASQFEDEFVDYFMRLDRQTF